MAASILQMCCRLGFAVGLALSSVVRDAVESTARHSNKDQLEASLHGLRGAFWTLVGFSLFCKWLYRRIDSF